MQKRQLLIATALAPFATARAHHGWSSFDDVTPIFLSGRATKVSWKNPHVELMLDASKSALPSDFAARTVPAQTAPVNGPDLLQRAKLAPNLNRPWEIELAPLPRMQAWQIAEFAAGTAVELLGYGLKDLNAKPVLRAEYLWVAGKTYALRSAPA